MKKLLTVLLANILVLSLVIALSVGGFGSVAEAAQESIPVNGENTVVENEELSSGPYTEISYILSQDEDEEGNVIFSAEAYKAVSYDEDDVPVYDISAWLLDQMGIKLDTTDGDIKNAVFTLGEAASADSLKVRLDTEGKLLIPSEDKGLVLVIPGCGKITIPAQTSECAIGDITISLSDDKVHFDAFSGETSVAGLEVLFEADEGTAYTLELPEVEADEAPVEA